ncbi:hypothetical protein TURU_105975 [Turdus rufiventris]|nr:hypothetical protein TURU_105975 [Turdus rufiventris]
MKQHRVHCSVQILTHASDRSASAAVLTGRVSFSICSIQTCVYVCRLDPDPLNSEMPSKCDCEAKEKSWPIQVSQADCDDAEYAHSHSGCEFPLGQEEKESSTGDCSRSLCGSPAASRAIHGFRMNAPLQATCPANPGGNSATSGGTGATAQQAWLHQASLASGKAVQMHFHDDDN